MNPTDSILHQALLKLLEEVFAGPPGREAYILNPGDDGLLGRLESLDAATASARPTTGRTTIAAHTDHVLYGLTLLNRWASGEPNPWADADWDASWSRTTVSDAQWRTLRDNLRQAYLQWRQHLAQRDQWDAVSAAGSLSSMAHTAYHLGAIRQLMVASA